jgi:hypothetical protein
MFAEGATVRRILKDPTSTPIHKQSWYLGLQAHDFLSRTQFLKVLIKKLL